MDTNTLLVKCITLLYRETQIENNTDFSSALVQSILSGLTIDNSEIGIASRRTVSVGLKDIAESMSRKMAINGFELSLLLQQLQIATQGLEHIYTACAQGIEPELSQTSIKRTVTSLKLTLSDYLRDRKIGEILKKASRDYNFNRHLIEDVPTYLAKLTTDLAKLSTKTTTKDLGITRTLDFSSDEGALQIFNDVANSASTEMAYSTGFVELDEALHGGPRPGDQVVVSALQHNYKTGFTLSVFAGMAIYNKPKCKDPNKKPLLWRGSAEDPIRNNAQFLYQLLKYEETGMSVDVSMISVSDMKDYVVRRMTATGFSVIIDEINPLEWDYQRLFNRISELEAQGYYIECACLDYYAKIPTTGCGNGVAGDDMLDMFVKAKAFFSSKDIMFLTPHQLNTKALEVLQVTPQDQFLPRIKGAGFYEKTKGLARIFDIGILIHKCEMPDADYLHVIIEKHRLPTVVDAKYKSFFLPFPKNKMPIPFNIGKPDHKVLRKIPKQFASPDDSFFGI